MASIYRASSSFPKPRCTGHIKFAVTSFEKDTDSVAARQFTRLTSPENAFPFVGPEPINELTLVQKEGVGSEHNMSGPNTRNPDVAQGKNSENLCGPGSQIIFQAQVEQPLKVTEIISERLISQENPLRSDFSQTPHHSRDDLEEEAHATNAQEEDQLRLGSTQEIVAVSETQLNPGQQRAENQMERSTICVTEQKMEERILISKKKKRNKAAKARAKNRKRASWQNFIGQMESEYNSGSGEASIRNSQGAGAEKTAGPKSTEEGIEIWNFGKALGLTSNHPDSVMAAHLTQPRKSDSCLGDAAKL